jgi:uncharacterized membrane protein
MAHVNEFGTARYRRMPRPRRNVGEAERWVSGAAGAVLIGWALQHRARETEAWAAGLLGAVLLYRAGSGNCPVYSAAGVNTADDSTRRALAGPRGVHVESSVVVNKPVHDLYEFWRRFENLPRVMQHLESVTSEGNGRTTWVARAPLGTTVQWSAEVINEVPDKVIGWRSVEGSTVVTAGSVNFEPLSGGQATEVRVKLQYEPPGGRLGSWVAWAFGEEPSLQIEEDLRRFKEAMETSLY